MSLVGDYGSDSESDKEQQQAQDMEEDKQGTKRKIDTDGNSSSDVSKNNNNHQASSKPTPPGDTKKKPKVPLPDMFDDEVATKSARSSTVAKYLKPEGAPPTPTQTTKPEGKTSNLTPPQLW
jgi:hypothetical protein